MNRIERNVINLFRKNNIPFNDIEDVFNDIYVRHLEGIGTIYSNIYFHIEQYKRQPLFVQYPDNLEDSSNTIDFIEREELKQIIRQGLNTLPYYQKKAIYLSMDFSRIEISNYLKCSPKNIRAFTSNYQYKLYHSKPIQKLHKFLNYNDLHQLEIQRLEEIEAEKRKTRLKELEEINREKYLHYFNKLDDVNKLQQKTVKELYRLSNNIYSLRSYYCENYSYYFNKSKLIYIKLCEQTNNQDIYKYTYNYNEFVALEPNQITYSKSHLTQIAQHFQEILQSIYRLFNVVVSIKKYYQQKQNKRDIQQQKEKQEKLTKREERKRQALLKDPTTKHLQKYYEQLENPFASLPTYIDSDVRNIKIRESFLNLPSNQKEHILFVGENDSYLKGLIKLRYFLDSFASQELLESFDAQFVYLNSMKKVYNRYDQYSIYFKYLCQTE